MMKNSLSKEELKNDLLYDTLKALSSSLQGLKIPLYVVGATARDVMMKLLCEDEVRRRTNDLDVAIALQNWSDFDRVKEKLEQNHFKKVKDKQKFFYKGEANDNDFEVDVVPFGNIAVNEQICWPPEGNPVMSVRCFDDVMAHSMDVSVDDEITFKIAPLYGQFLIKFDTWIDRHAKTDKDAVDMFYFLNSYYRVKVMNDSMPPDEIYVSDDDKEPTYEVLSAWWLAYDISKILSTEHLVYYIEIIEEELKKEEKSLLLYHFMNNISEDKEDRYELCFDIWSEIRNFLKKELEVRSNEN